VAWLDALGQSISPLARGLEYRSRRNAAIAANVANADTPGYRAVDVSFRRAAEIAGLPLAVTHPRHLRTPLDVPGDTVQLSPGEPRRDGNNVDIDREMVSLARNQIEYQFLARALAARFRRLKEAITGRESA
jgi:flagellar basal-body rod protein FlgB